MKIATWNVNGVRARIHALTEWLKIADADVVCLQETKSMNEYFPRAPIEALGYKIALFGQKSFNGVAILSRLPVEDVTCGLQGMQDDTQARYIEAVIPFPPNYKLQRGSARGAVRVANLYAPNGNPVGSENFRYKLQWMRYLEQQVKNRLLFNEAFILIGDYNIIPEAVDAKHPEYWVEDALYDKRSRTEFRKLINAGFTDAIRAVTDEQVFTFWNYRAGAWNKDNGIRIDHALLSPQAADNLKSAGIDKDLRSWEKPSDHIPVWIKLDTVTEKTS